MQFFLLRDAPLPIVLIFGLQVSFLALFLIIRVSSSRLKLADMVSLEKHDVDSQVILVLCDRCLLLAVLA